MTNISRVRFLYLACAAALGWLAAPNAFAHARMVRSTPKNGVELSESPKALELWFSELLDDSFNTVELYDAKETKDRKNLLPDKPQVDAKDRTHLTVRLPLLKPGAYLVEYRILSRDGHTAPGRLSFTITGKPRG